MKEIVIADCNKKYYEDLEKILIEFKKCCMVCSTGTGKTLMTSKFIKDHNLKTLVIIHQKSIEDVWLTAKDNFDLDLSIATYQSLIRNPKKYRGYDCYVIEEAHHAGAPKWGNAVSKLMNYKRCKNSYFIGLTATPLRYSDGVNVVDSLFDGNSVYGLNRSKAIELGLVPPADYICTLYSDKGILDRYANINKELMGRLKANLSNMIKIDEAFERHAPQNPKGIVFVDKINRIEEAKEMIRKSFPNSDIYSIHCKMTNQDIYEAIEGFKKSRSAFMVSVNMMNEGFHITGVNVIVMLRKTKSPILYLQQTGRGSSDVDKIVIFDFVANNESIQLIDSNMRKIEISNDEVVKFNNDGKFSDQFIIKNYAKDVLEVLRDIDIKLNGFWTDEEDQFLREHYPENGVKFCANALGRTKSSVKSRVRRLGLLSNDNWSDEEEQFLRENYEKNGVKFCANTLDRTMNAVYSKASHLGLMPGCWSDEEIQFLKEHYIKDGTKFCAAAIGRTERAIIAKAEKIGLIINVAWSGEEIKFLKEHYIKNGTKFCANALGRTECAVRQKAKSLGLMLGCWSDEEIQFLKENYAKNGTKFCSNALGRTERSIREKAKSLGLMTNRYWTDKEDQFLRDNYAENGSKFCANSIGRTEKAVKIRARTLGLLSDSHNRWTDKEDQFLRDNYAENGSKFCANFLGRTKSSVKIRARTLGLLFDNHNRWTDKEDQFLREHYIENGAKFCADSLGRTECTIKARARSLRLLIGDYRWTDKEDQFLKENYAKNGAKFCADALGRTEHAVKARAGRSGLSSDKYHWNNKDAQFLKDNYAKNGAKFCADALGRSESAVRKKANKLGLAI